MKVYVVGYASFYDGDDTDLYNETLGVYLDYNKAHQCVTNAIRQDEEDNPDGEEQTKDLGNNVWEYTDGWKGEHRRYKIEEKEVIE